MSSNLSVFSPLLLYHTLSHSYVDVPKGTSKDFPDLSNSFFVAFDTAMDLVGSNEHMSDGFHDNILDGKNEASRLILPLSLWIILFKITREKPDNNSYFPFLPFVVWSY